MLTPFYVVEYVVFAIAITALGLCYKGYPIVPIWASVMAVLVIINQSSNESKNIFIG